MQRRWMRRRARRDIVWYGDSRMWELENGGWNRCSRVRKEMRIVLDLCRC